MQLPLKWSKIGAIAAQANVFEGRLMSGSAERFARGAKAFLCLLLTLNLHLIPTGCEPSGTILGGEWRHLSLSGSELQEALAGSGFGAASAIEINSTTGEFRLVLPAGTRLLNGHLRWSAAGAEVSSIRAGAGGAWVQFDFDTSQRVHCLSTSRGEVWRPSREFEEPLALLDLGGVDSYLAANNELVSAARYDDDWVQAPAPMPGPPFETAPNPIPKPLPGGLTASLTPNEILNLLMVIVIVQGVVAHFPAIYFVFEAVVGLNLLSKLAGPSLVVPSAASPSSEDPKENIRTPLYEGRLRVRNELGATPIWYVVLSQTESAAGGNLLGNESIPAGAAREFAVPVGFHNVDIMVPTDVNCYRLYRWLQLDFRKDVVVEIVVDPTDAGVPYPGSCP